MRTDEIKQVEGTAEKMPLSPSVYIRRFSVDFISIFLLLFGAMLSAVQVRLQIAFGTPLGDGYVAQPPELYGFMALAVALATLSGYFFRWAFGVERGRRPHFFNHVMANLIFFFVVALLLPDVSLLQLAYFTFFSFMFGLMTIWWSPTLPDAGPESTLGIHFMKLWDRRNLLWLWTKTNISARYSQTILGILWIVMLPLSKSLIMAFVFSNVFRTMGIGDVPFLAFFLTAVAFWTFFQQGIQNSTVSILQNMGVVTQIYFPREILVLVKFFEALVDLSFVFVVALIINAFLGVTPGVNIFYLPVILLIQSFFMLGLMFFLSYGSVIIRDVPQLVAVLVQLLFYLSPILYPASAVPPRLQVVLFLNPMSGVLNAYRDVMIYHQPPDFVNLYYPLVFGGILFYTGYLFFKANESNLADYL